MAPAGRGRLAADRGDDATPAPGRREPIEGTALRLELYGENGEAPRLAGYGVDLAVPTVLFQAPEAGRYTLTYGGAVRRNGGFEPPDLTGAGEEEAWLEAGPERERPAAPLPAGAPGAPLGAGRFRGAWRVIAPSARPGDLVRLELRRGLRHRPNDLRDVRLAFRDLQVPFLLWASPGPALAAEARDLRPRPVRRERESEAEVDLPVAGLPLTQLFVTAPGAVPPRIVGVRYRPRRPVTRQRERGPLVRETWDCDPSRRSPAAPIWRSTARRPTSWRCGIHDGDDPPLAPSRKSRSRAAEQRPPLSCGPSASEESEVRLLAGARDLEAPDYDFAGPGGRSCWRAPGTQPSWTWKGYIIGRGVVGTVGAAGRAGDRGGLPAAGAAAGLI